jgi:hypothetical protein
VRNRLDEQREDAPVRRDRRGAAQVGVDHRLVGEIGAPDGDGVDRSQAQDRRQERSPRRAPGPRRQPGQQRQPGIEADPALDQRAFADGLGSGEVDHGEERGQRQEGVLVTPDGAAPGPPAVGQGQPDQRHKERGDGEAGPQADGVREEERLQPDQEPRLERESPVARPDLRLTSEEGEQQQELGRQDRGLQGESPPAVAPRRRQSEDGDGEERQDVRDDVTHPAEQEHAVEGQRRARVEPVAAPPPQPDRQHPQADAEREVVEPHQGEELVVREREDEEGDPAPRRVDAGDGEAGRRRQQQGAEAGQQLLGGERRDDHHQARHQEVPQRVGGRPPVDGEVAAEERKLLLVRVLPHHPGVVDVGGAVDGREVLDRPDRQEVERADEREEGVPPRPARRRRAPRGPGRSRHARRRLHERAAP